MNEELKELEARYKKRFPDSLPVFTNYVIGELSDGSCINISTCRGHTNFNVAMMCHDTLQPRIDTIFLAMRKSTPTLKKISCVIVKETLSLEFIE